MAESRTGFPSSVFRGRDVVVLCAALVLVAVVTLALQWVPDVSATTVALALLLIVLGTATVGRLPTAIVVSVASMLAFNFFFLPPVRTFTIADPQNWIALFAFLVVAVIASNLSASAQARTREAVARRNEVTRLFDLTRDVLLTTDTAGAIDAVARHVSRRFDIRRVAICLPADRGWQLSQGGGDAIHLEPVMLDSAFARIRGTLEFDARQRAYGGHATVGDRGEIAIVPLRHGMRAVGLLAADAPDLDIGTLDAIAGVVAIAIERAQFLADRDAAELVRQKADLAATLLASLSHDLRTPLTAIKVAVENLRGELPADERRIQAAAASAEIDRLAHLVQDILDMARVDAGGILVNRQWVTASDVVDAAIAHVQHAIDGHPLDVTVSDDVEVAIDPRLTSSALSHLLENAAQYSPPGTPIQVVGHIDHSGLSVAVTDEGPGLDPAELDHLFERFYRGRAARNTTGTGMGLSITRGLLAAAGGRVWAENVPAAGARFSLIVPGAVRAASVVGQPS
jgi:two-component system sensor histidine kinase KdpD